MLTCNETFPYREITPREYQARIVNTGQPDALRSTVDVEISIAEEEYVDLENQEQVARYAELLITQVSRTGEYTQGLRNLFVRELYMGDQNINYGQAGSLGRKSTDTIHNYEHAWEELRKTTDLNVLANELAELRAQLRQKAQTVDEDKAVVAVS